MRHRILFFFLAFIGISQFVTSSDVRNKYNFNSDWLLYVGDVPEAKQPRFSDSEWKKVTLPHAFNEDEAFRLSIDELTDTIMWYRKHFRLPANSKNKKVFVEFEGVRQGADFYINGQNVGLHENGVMAVGFDLTPYIKYGQENVIAVRIDNDWNYKERATGTKYQWSNKNFNANYGGIAQGENNYILSKDLPVECGINRALIRSLTTAGNVRITAKADGLKPAEISLTSSPVEVKNGLSNYIPGDELEGRLTRGETPQTPSYKVSKVDVGIVSAIAGANNESTVNSFDDNELSEWRNDGKAATAWITYKLERAARVDEVCMKLTGWRMRSYPLEIYAGKELIWSGDTDKSLGYVHLDVKPVLTNEITIRLKGTSKEGDAFGQIVEVAAPVANELDLFKAKDGDKTGHELRIVEIEFKENLLK